MSKLRLVAVFALLFSAPLRAEPTHILLADAYADALTRSSDQIWIDSLVVFEPGTSRVYSAQRERIAEIARVWKQRAWGKLTVEGYAPLNAKTDDLPLAQRRAEKIRDYFVRYGVAADQIVAIGRDSKATKPRKPIGRADLNILTSRTVVPPTR